MRSLQLLFREWEGSARSLVERFERLGKQLPARLRERIPDQQLPGVLLHGRSRRAERRKHLLDRGVVSLPFQNVTDSPEGVGDRSAGEQRNHQYLSTL